MKAAFLILTPHVRRWRYSSLLKERARAILTQNDHQLQPILDMQIHIDERSGRH
jgi:hypothetical protein